MLVSLYLSIVGFKVLVPRFSMSLLKQSFLILNSQPFLKVWDLMVSQFHPLWYFVAYQNICSSRQHLMLLLWKETEEL